MTVTVKCLNLTERDIVMLRSMEYYDPYEQDNRRTIYQSSRGKTWDLVPDTEDEYGYMEILIYRNRELRYIRVSQLDSNRYTVLNIYKRKQK